MIIEVLSVNLILYFKANLSNCWTLSLRALILQHYQVRALDTQAPRKCHQSEKIQTTKIADWSSARYLDRNHNQLKTYYNLVKTEGIHEPFLVQVQDKARGKLHARKVK